MEKYSDYFEKRLRKSNNESFYCLVDNPPEILLQFIWGVHDECFFGSLPNDWIYSVIREAFINCEDADADFEEIIESVESDVSNYEVKRWYADNSFAEEYCQLAFNEGFYTDAGSLIYQIRTGQWLAKRKIYDRVMYFLNDRASESLSKEELCVSPGKE